MRARVAVANRSGRVLPFDYRYAFAPALYGRLAAADPDLAARLHERPAFRHYRFSHLLGPSIRAEGAGFGWSVRLFHCPLPTRSSSGLRGRSPHALGVGGGPHDFTGSIPVHQSTLGNCAGSI